VLVGAKKLRIIPTKRIAFFWRKGHGEAESCLVVEIDAGGRRSGKTLDALRLTRFQREAAVSGSGSS
jgi:hypothetical protein